MISPDPYSIPESVRTPLLSPFCFQAELHNMANWFQITTIRGDVIILLMEGLAFNL